MSLEPNSHGESRGNLTRILSTESRNALARVELAASELARFDVCPSQRERIDAIRAAVEEMDGFLGRIDALSQPPRRGSDARVDVRGAAAAIFVRLAPALRARGLTIEDASLESLSRSEAVMSPLPRAALDGLLCRLVGVAGDLLSDESPVGIEVSRVGDAAVRIVLSGSRDENANRGVGTDDDLARLELDLELAEWGGGAFVRSDPSSPEGLAIGISLPLETELG